MSGCYCTAPATTGNLCTEHLGQLRMDLWKAPETLRHLDVTITGQAKQGGGGNGSGTPDVFNETASDRRQDLMVILRSAAHITDPRPRHVYAEEPRHLVARALSDVQRLARHENVHTVAQDLTDALVSAERVMDRAEEKISYGPCSCGVELVAPRSKDRATCRECGTVWDVSYLTGFKQAAVRDALPEYTGTVKDVLSVLGYAGIQVKRGTVDSWIARDKLRPVEGRIYRAKDIMELAGLN